MPLCARRQQEEPVLAQAPLLQLVCRAAVRAGIAQVDRSVHTFLAAAVQVRRPAVALLKRQGHALQTQAVSLLRCAEGMPTRNAPLPAPARALAWTGQCALYAAAVA